MKTITASKECLPGRKPAAVSRTPRPQIRSVLVISAVVFLASSALIAAPANEKQQRLTRPLTFENVVSFFKEAHLRPTEVQKRCVIFFEGEWKSADIYNYGIIL